MSTWFGVTSVEPDRLPVGTWAGAAQCRRRAYQNLMASAQIPPEAPMRPALANPTAEPDADEMTYELAPGPVTGPSGNSVLADERVGNEVTLLEKLCTPSTMNIYNLWAILKDNRSARSTWSLLGICQSMLANPLSTNQVDVDRRNRVKQRNIDFNTQLQQVCMQYSQCRFDNNAIFNTAFVPSDVSTRDYFHPSIAGQAKLAATAWQAAGLP